ncbi:MAG TPA: NYN domain-containing protein, partial [Streptosporangiaceae bacterium]
MDANYALAEGAIAVHGTRNRDSVSWDYAGLLKLLGSLSRERSGLPLLRCYWYDTVSDRARVDEHDTLADIPGVKLRLSKARPSRKEGVEAEIRKDLSALARNRAVSDVIIVSGEEDLAPVIAEVQDLGIRAILIHIATDGDWAISRTLRQECDDIIDIGSGHLRPYVDLISGAEPQRSSAGYREVAASSAQSSGPHPAIEAPPVRLYASTVAAEYEHAALATAGAGQGQDQRHEAGRFGGQGQALNSGPIAGSGDGQPRQLPDQHMPGSGLSQAQSVSAQSVSPQSVSAQPSMTQSSVAQVSAAQSS